MGGFDVFQLEIVQLHDQFLSISNLLKINAILSVLTPASRCYSLQV